MTTQPARPGAGTWWPRRSTRNRAALSSSAPRVNELARSAGARAGCASPYPVMNRATAAAARAVVIRSVRTVKW